MWLAICCTSGVNSLKKSLKFTLHEVEIFMALEFQLRQLYRKLYLRILFAY